MFFVCWIFITPKGCFKLFCWTWKSERSGDEKWSVGVTSEFTKTSSLLVDISIRFNLSHQKPQHLYWRHDHLVIQSAQHCFPEPKLSRAIWPERWMILIKLLTSTKYPFQFFFIRHSAWNNPLCCCRATIKRRGNCLNRFFFRCDAGESKLFFSCCAECNGNNISTHTMLNWNSKSLRFSFRMLMDGWNPATVPGSEFRWI